MKTATIVASVALGILIVSAILLFRWRSQRQEIKSFWDVVRNPDAMTDRDEALKEIDETANSLSGSPAKIAQRVDNFVFQAKPSRDADSELHILSLLGDETYPRALEILQDRALKEKLSQLTKHENSSPEAPINRLCELFDQNTPPPEEAAVLLAPFLQSDSYEIKKSVALIIGSIGSETSLPDLRRACTDQNDNVRTFALIGIQRAIAGHRIAESAKGDFFDIVASMWAADTRFINSDSISQILLKLDRERATQFLLSEEVLSANVRGTWQILSALGNESVEVPRQRLLTIIAAANTEPLEYPLDNVLEYALPLLGAHRNPEDLATFERFLEHENADVSLGAIKALYRYHRYYDRIRNPWDVVEQEGWHALTEVEKYICAISTLDSEVNNGGFAQYYFNSSGDRWQEALNGLMAIGAEKRHRLMQATLDSFEAANPSTDHKMRQTQLSRIVRKQENPFKEQDSAWYKTKDENLDGLLFKYNLANLAGREKGK